MFLSGVDTGSEGHRGHYNTQMNFKPVDTAELESGIFPYVWVFSCTLIFVCFCFVLFFTSSHFLFFQDMLCSWILFLEMYSSNNRLFWEAHLELGNLKLDFDLDTRDKYLTITTPAMKRAIWSFTQYMKISSHIALTIHVIPSFISHFDFCFYSSSWL